MDTDFSLEYLYCGTGPGAGFHSFAGNATVSASYIGQALVKLAKVVDIGNDNSIYQLKINGIDMGNPVTRLFDELRKYV